MALGSLAAAVPTATEPAARLLGEGDALWIEVSEPVNWWQPGQADPPILFLGDVPYRGQACHPRRVRRGAAVLRRALRGRDEGADPLHRRRRGGRAPDVPASETVGNRTAGLCAWRHHGIETRVLGCLGPPREHLRLRLPPWVAARGPRDRAPAPWCARHRRSRPRLVPGGRARVRPHLLPRGQGRPRDARSEPTWRTAPGGRRCPSSSLRGGRAPGRSGELLRSRARLPGRGVARGTIRRSRPSSTTSGSPRSPRTGGATFEAVFGITVDDFYSAFAAVRAEAFPPHPERAGIATGPAVVFLGDVPVETREAR